MKPLLCQAPAGDAIKAIASLLQQMPRVRIESRAEDYLHAIFRTKWLRFVDDVEFKIDPETKQLHYRSASRVGYSDLGLNRKRMNELTEKLLAMDCFTEAE
jgi:uncharacterized protein (DUF1499 family)